MNEGKGGGRRIRERCGWGTRSMGRIGEEGEGWKGEREGLWGR